MTVFPVGACMCVFPVELVQLEADRRKEAARKKKAEEEAKRKKEVRILHARRHSVQAHACVPVQSRACGRLLSPSMPTPVPLHMPFTLQEARLRKLCLEAAYDNDHTQLVSLLSEAESKGIRNPVCVRIIKAHAPKPPHRATP